MPTLTEYATRWIVTLSIHSRTKKNYERLLRLHILPILGDLELSAIQRRDVRAMLKTLLAEGRGQRTVQNAYVALSSLFASAVLDELVTDNPAHGATGGVLAARVPGWAAMRAMTRDELAQFLTAATSTVPQLADYFFVLAGTGMRPSEALGLRPGCVDVLRRRIHVRLQYLEGAEDLPKGRKARWLTDVPHEVIARLTTRTDPWCFQSPKTGKPWNMSYIQSRVHDVVQAAGLTRPYTCHTLRHTWATIMLEETGDLVFVSRQLGHSDVKVTSECYGSGAEPRHPDASDRLNALLHRRGPLRAGPDPARRLGSLPAPDAKRRRG